MLGRNDVHFKVFKQYCKEPKSDGLQPNSDGLQPKAMASNLIAFCTLVVFSKSLAAHRRWMLGSDELREKTSTVAGAAAA